MTESSNTEGEERGLLNRSCVGNDRKQQHKGRRERSPKQEYLGLRIVCLCLRRVSPYIGAEERRRGNEPERC
jgi:hypothetical protein